MRRAAAAAAAAAAAVVVGMSRGKGVFLFGRGGGLKCCHLLGWSLPLFSLILYPLSYSFISLLFRPLPFLILDLRLIAIGC